uniref:ornithine decarboxylase n=1 Tax=Mola mola TaxID=94237 RepID=A0A3Q3WVC8_MOLML
MSTICLLFISKSWKKGFLVCLPSYAAPVSSTGSTQSVTQVFSAENYAVNILDNGKTISDFIEDKIKEFGSMVSIRDLVLYTLFKRHLRWIANLPRVKPFYAVKCNNIPAVLRMLSALGTGFDCASKVEIQQVLSLRVTPDKIIYAHATKPLSHINFACTHGVNVMTFDSEDELLKISLCHAKAKLVLRIAVDDSTSFLKLSLKFGARLESAGKLLKRAAELGLEVIGVSFHVGSGCTQSLVFKQAIADARLVFDTAVGVMTFQYSTFYYATTYSLFPVEKSLQVTGYPGFIVWVKGFLPESIPDGEKDNADRMMMYYLSDGVYGSVSCLINDAAHSEVEPYFHRAVKSSEQRYCSMIWGPTCDSIDKLTDNYWIPELHVGDWLLIDNMGAYSISLCTDFNGFERPQIYPVVTAKTWHALNLSHTFICLDSSIGNILECELI